MNGKVHLAFLAVVILQAFHSIEEYVGQLWENFPPATFLCGLISDGLEKGFLIINIGLFVAGLIVWWFVVKPNHAFAGFFIWFWIVIELINGVGHPVWSVMQNSYTPGLITAPLLFIAAIHLMRMWLLRSPIVEH